MRLVKPLWVNHDGHPIFSVDIHPDGSRFATGGQGADAGRVIVWNMAPIINEADEGKENVPKLLCQMDNHLACVNCVRWSTNGKYLASGGDDKVVFIWSSAKANSNSFVCSMNPEHWRCAFTLRGHSGDILDISWSPNDNWLASCSIDNSVIIWNATKFPEMLTVLRGHTGLVKGVCSDPVGKYIASQADDKTLKVWRTSDWKEEVSVVEPFVDCGGTTHVLRLNWSPDGQYIVSAHAMNNRGSTAQIIEREGWKSDKDFVGHRKAVTCVRFNKNILSKNIKGKVQKFCCLAIGSRDRSLSVWLTTLKRPLVVVHDLFGNSLLDIAWSNCGSKLACCSWDGSVAFLEFEESEIGKPLSPEEKNAYMQKLYGKSLHSASSVSLIEDANILKAREVHQQKLSEETKLNGNVEPVRVITNDSRSNTASRLMKGPTDKQIETRMPDGRRRITPLYIPPPIDCDGIPIPFNVQQTTFSSSSEAKTKIVIEKREDTSNGFSKSFSAAEEMNNSVNLPNVDNTPITVVQSSGTSLSKRKADKSAEKELNKRKPGRPSQGSAVKQNVSRSPIVSQTEKKSKSETKKSLLQLPALKIERASSIKVDLFKDLNKKQSVVEVENNVNSSSLSAVRLMSSENEMGWEVLLSAKICGVSVCEFLVSVACDDNTLSVFSTLTGRRLQPPIVITSPAARLTCVKHYLMLITVKGSLCLWDFGKHQIIVKNESLVPLFASTSNETNLLNTGITDNGCPLISLTNGKSYIFDVSFSTWSLISNATDVLSQNSDFKPPWKSEPSAFPLSVVQSQHKFMTSVNSSYIQQTSLHQSATLSFIDQQLAAAFVMGSSKEYRFWLLALAQSLTNENIESRLREICQYLLGPPFKSSSSKWENSILGNEKHSLLREVLSIMTSNLRLQRLYTEFKEQLDAISSTML
ncbi:Protein HIRA-like protein [Leptotrombidium deliense]|uniref:Protein HIRA n=1 Tax=Leptotrombidium deliense TaxID=299467 RepID=A0A443SLR3_9ACAR|nr:Protein HIRA-like protein [Leptotrombidium deliense]